MGYFRSFEPGDPPASTGNLYRDLTLAKRGVCRHRAFAFVVTAQSIGIPARYITNEAHAFVEVWVPGVGWLQVDLGGGSNELDVENARDKAMHHPRQPDPFPRPAPYQKPARFDGIDDTSGAGGTRPDPGTPPRPDPTQPPTVAPGTGLPALPPGATAGKAPVELVVEHTDAVGFRGEAVRVSGSATSQGRPVAGLPVDIFLAPAGAAGDGARLIGRTVTDADGSFTASIDLPRDIPLGETEVFADTPGDKTHAATVSH